MILDIILFCIALAIIMKSGSIFVDSACWIARTLRVPEVIIGLTIVSFATTTPEFVISTLASSLLKTGISFGTAIGSVIVNIGLILALVIIARPISFTREEFQNSLIMFLAGFLIITLSNTNLQLSRWEGLILIILLMLFVVFAIDRELKRKTMKPMALILAILYKIKSIRPKIYGKHPLLFFILSAIGIVIGSRILIYSGVNLASFIGVPEIAIALTLIAIGTSLPELITAITSAYKNVPELSLGNIIGANILNITWVLGAASLVNPIPIDSQSILFNNPMMLLFSLLIVIFLATSERLSRRHGILLFAMYIFYVITLSIIY